MTICVKNEKMILNLSMKVKNVYVYVKNNVSIICIIYLNLAFRKFFNNVTIDIQMHLIAQVSKIFIGKKFFSDRFAEINETNHFYLPGIAVPILHNFDVLIIFKY